MNLALVYKKLDTTSIVTQAYNNVIRVLHPELIAYPYNDLATFYLQKTMWRNAIAAYQRTLDGNPDLNDSYYFIGMSYMNLSEHQIATIMYGHSCPK
ncbi:MAG: hypothetical protein WCX28_01460 [Bacteriovoracaceae bacterium]|nr:hypothetical protein [Bacteroidota bacterium]